LYILIPSVIFLLPRTEIGTGNKSNKLTGNGTEITREGKNWNRIGMGIGLKLRNWKMTASH